MVFPAEALQRLRLRSPRVLSLAALIATAALAQCVFDLHYLVGVFAAVSAYLAVKEACELAARARQRSAP